MADKAEEIFLFVTVCMSLVFAGFWGIKWWRNRSSHIKNSPKPQSMNEHQQDTVQTYIDEPEDIDIDKNGNVTDSNQPTLLKYERVKLFKEELDKTNGVSNTGDARALIAKVLEEIEGNHAPEQGEKMIVPALNALETQAYGKSGLSILLNGHRIFINSNGAFIIIDIKTCHTFLEKNNVSNIPFAEVLNWVPKMPAELAKIKQLEDEGRQAFRNRVSVNPYPESGFQFDKWQSGWNCEKQSNPDIYDHVNDWFFEEK